MESQPQNPEFRNNPENFHPCISSVNLILKRTRSDVNKPVFMGGSLLQLKVGGCIIMH